MIDDCVNKVEIRNTNDTNRTQTISVYFIFITYDYVEEHCIKCEVCISIANLVIIVQCLKIY